MDLITLDFETYYDRDYSLSKMTTEEYIRDPRFEVVGVGVKVGKGETEWASGTMEQLRKYLRRFDLGNSMMLAHNTMFDGAILSWHFDIQPKALADTMHMSRALHGVEASASLKAVAERYGVGVKGTEVVRAMGKRRLDFTEQELSTYGDYCINDVNLTFDLFAKMSAKFPIKELKLIDLTLRMFTAPTLALDAGRLHTHLATVRKRKEELLVEAGIEDKSDLMSNPKFAALLTELGVIPPMKISPTTGKETYAFAKNDEEFKALLEHDDDRVQSLVSARLGTKSTLEETRTQRFIDIASRGLLPVPVRYYAAHTGRWGGDDKINLQNLPSRGPNAKSLKKAIIAPEGYTIIEADSAQIEARVLAWLAGQEDLVSAFTNKEDVYKKMASTIYGVSVDDVTKDQRFVGKTTILGAGYGMGALKFQAQLKTFGFDMPLDEARRVINIYRDANWNISNLWKEAQIMLRYMVQGNRVNFGKAGVIGVDPDKKALILPSGLPMYYTGLFGVEEEKGPQYYYKTRAGDNKIYGGKVVENVCQAIARCIIGEQMLRIAKRYKVVLTVHDSIVCCVPDAETDAAKAYVEESMRWVPDWANGLPVDCEAGTAQLGHWPTRGL
jgi:DNA polymerase I-like protein with 3'-5' exonuclease and polymerase domains